MTKAPEALKLVILTMLKRWTMNEPVVTLATVKERLTKGHATLSELAQKLDNETRVCLLEKLEALISEQTSTTPAGECIGMLDWERFDSGLLEREVLEHQRRSYRALACVYTSEDEPKMLNIESNGTRLTSDAIPRQKLEKAGLKVATVMLGGQTDPALFDVLWNWKWPTPEKPTQHLSEDEVDALWDRLSECEIQRGGIFIHYRALTLSKEPKHAYHVLHLALKTKGCEPVVVYYDMRAPHRIWVRDLAEFAADVVENKVDTHRFHPLGYSEDFAPEAKQYHD